MKRTHTETVEYFEHEETTYRRFTDGSWWEAVRLGICSIEWTKVHWEQESQLEAIYQQPQPCKSCKFYDENPHLHFAVHPMGPEGVCGDWEQRPSKVAPLKDDHYRHLVGQLNSASRDLYSATELWDQQGRRMREHLRQFGIDPARMPSRTSGQDYFLNDFDEYDGGIESSISNPRCFHNEQTEKEVKIMTWGLAALIVGVSVFCAFDVARIISLR